MIDQASARQVDASLSGYLVNAQFSSLGSHVGTRACRTMVGRPLPEKMGGGRRGWRGGEVGGEEGMDAVREGDG